MYSSQQRREYGREISRLKKKYHSTTHYLLSSLIPYTESNLKLVFMPHKFFNDLEKLSGGKRKASTLKGGYYRAIKQDLIRVNERGMPELTDKGVRQLKRYEPRKLSGEASILVIFDIPERQRHSRRQLRALLRELKFVPIQQSVWRSEYDVLEYLVPELTQLGLSKYVQVHEAAQII